MNALRELMSPEEPNRRRIGFEAPLDGSEKLKESTDQLRKRR
jgi:hypothetical protein